MVQGYEIDKADSTTVVVNKRRPLNPVTYVPKPLTRIKTEQLRSDAALAYQEMVQAAKKERVNIVAISGYRSYDHQASLYANYVQQYGQETATANPEINTLEEFFKLGPAPTYSS